ncbi:type I DNA topoisomerase [Mycoplasma sp. ES3157-GEN-MYC]|uniref:DNA topoisomerase 1 n=1 Tax=Mycoplasma miroungigenitalium TaxID=754515 RepID=A0A6M4JCM6_9MOLU|nr:type I DNA topoisomerase [Mycoplasma miroungigenitalium]MBU4690698.1 type I DNA topoisomerase [Mycoplasma miroungigenitalium]MBU4691967.1 type I DNA topoisomerase [Mycoplasma miroungigenitalium]QJR43819.1 type I DNA topoisomerase [Mycoplasma miroungigenitalium]
MSKLVIVESPNKVATIKKYLGDDFDVLASVGHIAKLSTRTIGNTIMGIKIDEWEPVYVIDSTKKSTVKKLKSAVKKADEVFIATDPDREGEAIGDHLVKYLDIQDKYSRIKYNEITKDAILKAISHPGKLDEALIDAQKARRMLDRIIGFKLSKLMKQKLSNSPTKPSAGRVQSIALKLIVDREKLIEAFIPRDYHKACAYINENFKADYYNDSNPSGEKDWIYPEEKDEISEKIFAQPNSLVVESIKETRKKMGAITPLKQAVLYKKSPFSSQSTQRAAQNLYEGYGDGGLISYPRTDSTRLSQYFIDNARKYIKIKYGKEYVSEEIKGFSGDQDAHEAIRPTDITLTPEEAKNKFKLNNYDYQVYKLIYEHTLQALINVPIRMSKAYVFDKQGLKFRLTTSKILFNGYYVVKGEREEVEDPNYSEGQVISVEKFEVTDHQTNPPSRYSEGSLIEALDNIKVGRPSTFASTVKIVLDREYAENINGALHPTEFGRIVMDKLTESFPKIIEEGYTAQVEEELDLIAQSKVDLKPVMQEFWDNFNRVYDEAEKTMEHTTISYEFANEKCPQDGAELIIRKNRYGNKFIGCPNFPKCKFAKNYEK